ncbi:MAG: hypothetical protein SNJ49_10110, partial [Chloracidobacterium sp.]
IAAVRLTVGKKLFKGQAAGWRQDNGCGHSKVLPTGNNQSVNALVRSVPETFCRLQGGQKAE